MDRWTQSGLNTVLVEAPVAMAAFVSFLLAPDIVKPVLGCFAGALFVWWQSDKKRWDRRLGYTFVSLVLGAVFGYSVLPLVRWLWPGFPPEFDVAVYCFATLAGIYIAGFVRAVFRAWTDDPEEAANLVKDVVRRWARRDRRPPSNGDAS